MKMQMKVDYKGRVPINRIRNSLRVTHTGESNCSTRGVIMRGSQTSYNPFSGKLLLKIAALMFMVSIVNAASEGNKETPNAIPGVSITVGEPGSAEESKDQVTPPNTPSSKSTTTSDAIIPDVDGLTALSTIVQVDNSSGDGSDGNTPANIRKTSIPADPLPLSQHVSIGGLSGGRDRSFSAGQAKAGLLTGSMGSTRTRSLSGRTSSTTLPNQTGMPGTPPSTISLLNYVDPSLNNGSTSSRTSRSSFGRRKTRVGRQSGSRHNNAMQQQRLSVEEAKEQAPLQVPVENHVFTLMLRKDTKLGTSKNYELRTVRAYKSENKNKDNEFDYHFKFVKKDGQKDSTKLGFYFKIKGFKNLQECTQSGMEKLKLSLKRLGGLGWTLGLGVSSRWLLLDHEGKRFVRFIYKQHKAKKMSDFNMYDQGNNYYQIKKMAITKFMIPERTKEVTMADALRWYQNHNIDQPHDLKEFNTEVSKKFGANLKLFNEYTNDAREEHQKYAEKNANFKEEVEDLWDKFWGEKEEADKPKSFAIKLMKKSKGSWSYRVQYVDVKYGEGKYHFKFQKRKTGNWEFDITNIDKADVPCDRSTTDRCLIKIKKHTNQSPQCDRYLLLDQEGLEFLRFCASKSLYSDPVFGDHILDKYEVLTHINKGKHDERARGLSSKLAGKALGPLEEGATYEIETGDDEVSYKRATRGVYQGKHRSGHLKFEIHGKTHRVRAKHVGEKLSRRRLASHNLTHLLELCEENRRLHAQ